MKKIVTGQTQESSADRAEPWLDVTTLADVRITTEDPAHPIEGALELRAKGAGWRAGGPGRQTIALQFHAPQAIRQIHLRFEADESRTQEFVLSWSNDGGRTHHDLVRQQFNFSSGGTTWEEENYFVDLPEVTELALNILPDISGGPGRAALHRLRLR